MTPQPPERPDLDAPEARITRDKADGMEWSYTSGEDVLELIAYARSLEAELTRLRAVEEAAMDVVAADLIDNVWLRDKWIPALRAALREKGAESE